MFNAHISFIKSMIEKKYFGEIGFLLKNGAAYDIDVWKSFRSMSQGGGDYNDFVRAFFLIGLGCGEEEKIIEFLSQDKKFAYTVLRDLNHHLFQSYYNSKRYIINGDLPEPFSGVKTKVAYLYKKLLEGTKLVEVISDRDAFIVPNFGSDMYYNPKYDEDYESKGDNKRADLGCLKYIMRDYAMLHDSRLMFFDNFSNFQKFNLGSKNSGLRGHPTKNLIAFCCTDLNKLKDNLTKIYKAKRVYIPLGFTYRAKLKVRSVTKEVKKRKDDVLEGIFSEDEILTATLKAYIPSFLGLPHLGIYIPKDKLGIQKDDGKMSSIIFKVIPMLKFSENSETKATVIFSYKLKENIYTFDYSYDRLEFKEKSELFQSFLPDPFEVELIEVDDKSLVGYDMQSTEYEDEYEY